MRKFEKSHKLENVCYDIRGRALTEAKRLEDEGYSIIRLNIGNTMPFGLEAPEECLHDIIVNMRQAQGYCDSKGLFSARKAVMQYCQEKGIDGVDVEDVYMGNGVSEMIVLSMQGLLNNNNEVLVPAPDYPLWTAAVHLAGGKPVHYICDEQQGWYPDIKDMRKKITNRTRAIVIINPNNPTGSVYPPEILEQIVELARQHGLAVLSDEIYDKIMYDDVEHVSTASLADDVLFVTFNGLSKVYRAPGFRAGWMVISGATASARDYVEGLEILSSMRLCSNVPSQFAVQTALGGYQSIRDMVKPGGVLWERREIAYKLISEIPGLSCVKPNGALYLFPKIDRTKIPIKDDQRMILDLLLEQRVLLVQGTGFSWPEPDHFRVVFLPRPEELQDAMGRLKTFFSSYKQS